MIYYYILSDPDKPNFTKLGITKDPTQRIKAYRTAAPQASFLKVYTLPHKIHEKRILELFKHICPVQSECVSCTPELAQSIIECYLTDNNIDFN